MGYSRERFGIAGPARVALACLVLVVLVAGEAQAGRRPGPAGAALRALSRVPMLDSVNPATANELAAAMDIPAADLVSASLGTSDPAGVGVGTVPMGRFFPRKSGTFAILSTGLASDAASPNNAENTSTFLAGLKTTQGQDMVQLRLRLRPPAGARCLAFDFAFYSEEFPEWVNSEFNDAFIAEIGGSTFQIVGNEVVAPLNFAIDTAGRVISVNTVFGVTAGTQTTYDGGTPLLRAVAALGPNAFPEVDVVLSIMDLGDSIYDSAVFLDNFTWLFTANCATGAGLADQVVSPPTGYITRDGNFDLVLFESLPVAQRFGTMNGIDVSANLNVCIRGTRTDGAGNTLRCPGLSGALIQSILGPGPYTLDLTLNYIDATSQSGRANWEVPTTGTPNLTLLPPSGAYAATQRWDLIVLIGPGAPEIVGGSATFDGTDITGNLVSCVNANPREDLGGAGSAVRCPLAGSFFTAGPHVLSLNLQFVDGTSSIDTVTWKIVANTEP